MATSIPIPKPLEIDLALYRKHIRQVRATEEQKKTMRRALENWRRITETRQITARRLRPIVEAAKSKYAAVWIMCGELLANLVDRFPEAKEAYRDIARNGNAAQRWHMIACLIYCKDREFCREIVENAIADRSSEVCRRAAYAADLLWMTELVPALKQRHKIESSAQIANTLDYHIAIMSDGYYLTQVSGQQSLLKLTVRSTNGWGSTFVRPEAVEGDRLKKLVKEYSKPRF